MPVKTLVVQADLSEVEKIRQFLRESLSELEIGEKDFFKLELALVEVCINIIRYAYPGEKGKISIEIRKGRGRVSIEIRDSGIAFRSEEPPQARHR